MIHRVTALCWCLLWNFLQADSDESDKALVLNPKKHFSKRVDLILITDIVTKIVFPVAILQTIWYRATKTRKQNPEVARILSKYYARKSIHLAQSKLSLLARIANNLVARIIRLFVRIKRNILDLASKHNKGHALLSHFVPKWLQARFDKSVERFSEFLLRKHLVEPEHAGIVAKGLLRYVFVYAIAAAIAVPFALAPVFENWVREFFKDDEDVFTGVFRPDLKERPEEATQS